MNSLKNNNLRKKKPKQWAIVSSQIEAFIPCSLKLHQDVTEVTKLPIEFMGTGQDPFSADRYASERWQILQDQQLATHCHTPIPSSVIELTKKILV